MKLKFGSSKKTGAIILALDETDTIRAPDDPAARAARSPVIKAKWPRKFVANCISQPSGVRWRSCKAIIPALLIRICRGPVQSAQNLLTEARSETSRDLTSTASLPVETRMSSATARAAAGRRTARVTAAPAALSAFAVSRPMPEAPPVTMARFPLRSTPSITSAAVELKLKFVVIRSMNQYHLTSVGAKLVASDALTLAPDRLDPIR